MSKTEEKLKQITGVIDLQSHLTDAERVELAAWEKQNRHTGKGTSDWPGWVAVAVRCAKKEQEGFFQKISYYSYVLAMLIVILSTVYLLALGAFFDLPVEQVNGNFDAAARTLFLVMFFHALAKFAAHKFKARGSDHV